jgi:FtsH-binding integral membrane protein
MKTLRVIWIGIGVLALLAGLRAFELSQLAGSTRAMWTNLLAVGFAFAILASAIFANRSEAARRILLVCWVLAVVYCIAFLMLVGLEFGPVWFAIAISVGALSTASIWIVRRQRTSKSQSL